MGPMLELAKRRNVGSVVRPGKWRQRVDFVEIAMIRHDPPLQHVYQHTYSFVARRPLLRLPITQARCPWLRGARFGRGSLFLAIHATRAVLSTLKVYNTSERIAPQIYLTSPLETDMSQALVDQQILCVCSQPPLRMALRP